MKAIVGGGIALILIALYMWSIGEAVAIAWANDGGELKTGFVNTMNTVGGLVSALVISELAVTEPGEAPGARIAQADDLGKKWAGRVKSVAVLYIAAWTLFGLAAYVVGVMLREGAVPALTDFGGAWLGLAVASGYAYFGLGRAPNGQ